MSLLKDEAKDRGQRPEGRGHPCEIGKKKAFHWVKKSGIRRARARDRGRNGGMVG